jgi:hypothetical protein
MAHSHYSRQTHGGHPLLRNKNRKSELDKLVELPGGTMSTYEDNQAQKLFWLGFVCEMDMCICVCCIVMLFMATQMHSIAQCTDVLSY